MYTLTTYDKHNITLTDEEALQVLEAKKAGGTIIIKGNAIEANNISGIYSTDNESRKDQTFGYLHDGTRVVRQFGQWMCDNGQFDERGLLYVRPDPIYYPEVSVDLIATATEWQQIGSEFYSANSERIKRISAGRGSMQSIKQIIETKK